MISLLSEILQLRDGRPLSPDVGNQNRHAVVTGEPDGSRTAFLFTTPVYNARTRRALDFRFYERNKNFFHLGSTARTVVTKDGVRLENTLGACTLSLRGEPTLCSEHELSLPDIRLYPGANGVALLCSSQPTAPFHFSLSTGIPGLEVWSNDRCLALMSGKFRPFLSLSVIGTADASRTILAPAKLDCRKINEERFAVTLTPLSPFGKAVLFEINLYEPKLFRDTTVESRNPTLNNAFGGVAFVGDTQTFGEQWLYASPDAALFSGLPGFPGREIRRVLFHLPKLSKGNPELCALGLSKRFCSFGSNWNNKKAPATALPPVVTEENRVTVDLTPAFQDKSSPFPSSKGFLLKCKHKNAGFCAVATADNYFTPPILEINYQ